MHYADLRGILMKKEKNNGSLLEGLTTELGGLMGQDTDGKVEHIRKTITNEPDGGIDYIRSVSLEFDYFEYICKCKEVEDGSK